MTSTMNNPMVHKQASQNAIMTPREAAEKLIPEFKKIAKHIWKTNTRGIGQDLIQEMAMSCLCQTGPAPANHFLADARQAALMFLRRERKHERMELIPNEDVAVLSDELGYRFPDPADADLDPKPKSIPLPTHPVFRFLSQAV